MLSIVGTMVVGRGVGAAVDVVGNAEVALLIVSLYKEGAGVLVGADETVELVGLIVGAVSVKGVEVGGEVMGAVVKGDSVGDVVTGTCEAWDLTGLVVCGTFVARMGARVKGAFDTKEAGGSVGKPTIGAGAGVPPKTGAGAGALVIKTKGGKVPCRLRFALCAGCWCCCHSDGSKSDDSSSVTRSSARQNIVVWLQAIITRKSGNAVHLWPRQLPHELSLRRMLGISLWNNDAND